QDDDAAARDGVAAEQAGAREARRALRMYPVRLLLDLVPVLLVERREVPGAGGAAAGLSLADRQPRPGADGAARQPRGSVQALSLPHDHELRESLSEGAQSGQGDRRDQEADGGTAGGLACTKRSSM